MTTARYRMNLSVSDNSFHKGQEVRKQQLHSRTSINLYIYIYIKPKPLLAPQFSTSLFFFFFLILFNDLLYQNLLIQNPTPINSPLQPSRHLLLLLSFFNDLLLNSNDLLYQNLLIQNPTPINSPSAFTSPSSSSFFFSFFILFNNLLLYQNLLIQNPNKSLQLPSVFTSKTTSLFPVSLHV